MQWQIEENNNLHCKNMHNINHDKNVAEEQVYTTWQNDIGYGGWLDIMI